MRSSRRGTCSRGAAPTVVLSKLPSELSGVTARQQRIAAALGVDIADGETAFTADHDLIVDGLLGFSGRGDPRGTVADLIGRANLHAAPTLAIDLPSGLDATTGERGDPCIVAAATIALVLPKRGFATTAGRTACGEIMVGDIGVPPSVLARAGIEVPPGIFARSPVIDWSPPDA